MYTCYPESIEISWARVNSVELALLLRSSMTQREFTHQYTNLHFLTPTPPHAFHNPKTKPHPSPHTLHCLSPSAS